jgi:TldD protein
MLERLEDHSKNFSGYTELRWQANHVFSLSIRNGLLGANARSRHSGVSARCHRNGVFGFAATQREDDEAIAGVLADAFNNAGLVGSREAGAQVELPRTGVTAGVFDYHSRRGPLATADRVDLLRAVDARIGAKYRGIVNWILALETLALEKAVVTSEGAATYSYIPRAALVLSLSGRARDGNVALSDVVGGFGELEDQSFDVDAIVARVDQLCAQLRLKAEGVHCEPGIHDVVLHGRVSAILAHEAIGHTCEADSVLSGSVAGDHINDLVASEKITLGDYAGRGPDGAAPLAIHVDDEGTPCRDVTIIDKGVLKGLLHNKETARRLDAEPTGNARAFGFADEPLVRMRNTAILPGTDRIEDMIAAVDRGYLLVRPTNGQADWTSEFTFGASCGYEIRGGKIGRAIRDTTISGVAFEMLKTVTHVGDTLHWEGAAGFCGKKQAMPVGMGGPALKCRVMIGGRQ